MDGENIMGLTIELMANLFQSFMFVGFSYLFFEKPVNKLMRIIPFWVAIGLSFGLTTFFLFFAGTLSNITTYHLDSLLAISLYIAYTLFFLKGKIYLRIIMPIIAFEINALVSYSYIYFVSFVTKSSLMEAMTVSTELRYISIAVTNLTTAFFLLLLLKLGSKRIRLKGSAQITAFVIIPTLCLVILYCTLFAFYESGFRTDILFYLMLICIAMFLIGIITCVMLVKISHSNEIKTQLLLTSQREKLYEESILASNKQIEKISSIKHDMKNTLSSLKELISRQSLSEAEKLCVETTKELESAYTPISTSNPVLNAIVNVELEKASSLGIDLSVTISDPLTVLSSADTVSIIGNLCDNAIEYLTKQSIENREIFLHIHNQLEFYVITCKNRIVSSVIDANPDFATTKEDKSSHGKGISILQRIASEHDGNIIFTEEDGYFIVSIMLPCKQ